MIIYQQNYSCPLGAIWRTNIRTHIVFSSVPNPSPDRISAWYPPDIRRISARFPPKSSGYPVGFGALDILKTGGGYPKIFHRLPDEKMDLGLGLGTEIWDWDFGLGAQRIPDQKKDANRSPSQVKQSNVIIPSWGKVFYMVCLSPVGESDWMAVLASLP